MASVIYDPTTVCDLGGVTGGSWDFDDQLLVKPVDNTRYSRIGELPYAVTNNIDRYLFGDVQLKAWAGYSTTFVVGQWVELYMICEELIVLDGTPGTNYEDGDDSIEPPAANYIGSFIFSTDNDPQVHILRQIPLPPLMFKFLLINKADLISDVELKMRPYRYKTLGT